MNEFDNEFVRKQLFKIYGEPKGYSYNEFLPELDKMINEIHQQRLEQKKLKSEYESKHKFCPKCGDINYSMTFVDYILDISKKEEYKDLNNCICTKCGDKHTKHERI